jgi:chromosome segregation ATPase
MSAGEIVADAAALGALVGSTWTWFSAWRRRERDRAVAAATAPFTSGKEVADEAQRVLALRAAALEESQQQRTALRERNAELQAQNSAQEKQISELYSQIGKLTAENSEVREKLAQAKVREDADRTRINELEARVSELSKHMGLGQ